MKISDDTRLLDFFFNPRCSDDNDEFRDQKPFLVFNLLVNYIFGYEDISYQARDAILLILTASRKLDFVARHVAHVVSLVLRKEFFPISCSERFLSGFIEWSVRLLFRIAWLCL